MAYLYKKMQRRDFPKDLNEWQSKKTCGGVSHATVLLIEATQCPTFIFSWKTSKFFKALAKHVNIQTACQSKDQRHLDGVYR